MSSERRDERRRAALGRVLEDGEPITGSGVCWAAIQRSRVPLFILGRHQYDVVLTDRRIMMFTRRRRRRGLAYDVAFAKHFASLTLESARNGVPLLQHRVSTNTGSGLVVEWRPRHRALGHRFADALPRA